MNNSTKKKPDIQPPTKPEIQPIQPSEPTSPINPQARNENKKKCT